MKPRPPIAETFHRLVEGRQRGPFAACLRAGLGLVSIPYRVAVELRNLSYCLRLSRTYKVERPVIAIGNLTLGGTGKTPMVEWVARYLRGQSLRVTVLSRGYKGHSGLNDEGLLLDQNLPDVPHLQDRDRVRLARIAIDELDAQVLLLDDGFQHRRLARDLDIVLLDALCPFGLNRMFPRGLLREPLHALRRAHAIVLTRADLVAPETRMAIQEGALRAAGPKVWAECAHSPRDLVDFQANPHNLAELQGRAVVAFCGIGNPEAFRLTLENLGVPPRAFRVFPDHHAYSRADVEELARFTIAANADLALTTQKDLVKLRVASLGGIPLMALRVGLNFSQGAEELESLLQNTCSRYRMIT
jgi:tetraacyldisaccharide 4'-kinase